MHELGLVTHVVRAIEEIGKEENMTEVASVTLEIGEVSGVIPDYLEDCWKYFRGKVRTSEGSGAKNRNNTGGNDLRGLPEDFFYTEI